MLAMGFFGGKINLKVCLDESIYIVLIYAYHIDNS